MDNSILITGVTGIVGSHVFYELLEEMIYFNANHRLHLLIRPKAGQSGRERLNKEVLNPQLLPIALQEINLNHLLEKIEVIEGTLENCVFPESLGNQIKVYHIAASVNLGESDKSFIDIYENNYQATHSILRKLEGRIANFNFVSTAFSSGERSNEITDDYQKYNQFNFRNPYERYKFKMESELLLKARAGQFKLTIVRPSVVCGRMIKEPHFVMNRYIVFYMIGVFMRKMVKKYGEIGHFRLVADPKSTLNIVPVDYVAKGIVRAARTDEEQVNLTLSKGVPNKFWLDHIMEKEGVKEIEYVAEIPQDLSPIEQLYYHTVGAQINKYLKTAHHSFSSTKVRQLMPDIEEPNVIELFPQIYNFAHDRSFRIGA